MHIPVKYLRRSRQLQHWQLAAICSSGSPAYLRWIAARPPQVGAKCKSSILVQFSNINSPSANMELWGNRAVKSYITSADDVHIKYFHSRQSPTTTGLPTKWNRAQIKVAFSENSTQVKNNDKLLSSWSKYWWNIAENSTQVKNNDTLLSSWSKYWWILYLWR